MYKCDKYEVISPVDSEKIFYDRIRVLQLGRTEFQERIKIRKRYKVATFNTGC